ncbi:MAG: arginine N-succinyltransferase [Nevskiaceae bacterium]|nr:MAG: arginine N-succinyltransferase [Nevskiaceae bacterium]
MRVVRPIRADDLDALLRMARAAGSGFTSLPPNAEYLRRKIDLSLDSFAREVRQPGSERYLFVMEETDTGEVGGCCAIEAACGLEDAFYNYHVGVTVHASRELKIYNRIPTLYLSNDYTGASVLCSLYLSPAFREGNTGKLLSRSRFMFMASHLHRFAGKVIAEMRGVSNAQGRSPFWEGLGRHFFSIDYDDAEHIVGTGNKSCIAELMPPHPIYTVLLPQEARDVMGKVHPQTAPALKLLEQEGFRYQGYIDIFDGGPTVEAPTGEIRTIRRSRLHRAHGRESIETGQPHLVATTDPANFRCTLVHAQSGNGEVALPTDALRTLQAKAGDTIRLAPL